MKKTILNLQVGYNPETGKYYIQDNDNPRYGKISRSFEKIKECAEELLNDFEIEVEKSNVQPTIDLFKTLNGYFAPENKPN